MPLQRNRFNQVKTDLLKWLLVTVPIAHRYTDLNQARYAMCKLLHYHSTMVAELCSCYVCTTIEAAYERNEHSWRFCNDQFRCNMCYNLISETMHVLLPKSWPMWAKRWPM